MRYKFAKFGCTLLAGILMLAAAGCGSSKEDDGSNRLEIARWDMAQINAAKKENSPIYRAVADATGVDITVMSVAESAYEEKLNLLYTSDSLPDIFVTRAWDTPAAYRRWIKDDAIVNLSEYVTEQEYPNVYARLKRFDFLKDTISYAGGSHYSIPILQSPLHALFIRTDWIDNLNAKLGDILVAEGIATSAEAVTEGSELYETYKFAIPTTLTEFYRLAYAFTYYDPDGNGRADTYGYSCGTDNMWYNNWIFEAMSSAERHDSAYWGYLEGADGKLQSAWITEGSKQTIYFLNKLYQEGIMNPDYIVLSTDDERAQFVQGKLGMYMENNYYNTILGNFMSGGDKSMEEARKMFTCITPPAGEWGVGGNRTDPGYWSGVCISNKLSDRKIKLALSFLDWLMGDEAQELFTWGIEGEHYELVNGEHVSKMGTDSKGFNKTLKDDNAYCLCTLSSWTYLYDSPYESNRDLLDGFWAQQKAAAKHESVATLQTDLFLEYDNALNDNSLEQYVKMIKDKAYYNSGAKKGLAVKNDDWKEITGGASMYSAAYNTAWTEFTGKFLDDWHGQAVLDEMSDAYAGTKELFANYYRNMKWGF